MLEVGFTFFKDAIGKIREPEVMNFQMVSVVILTPVYRSEAVAGSFLTGSWGKRIDSKVMMATATDAMGDVITTAATIAVSSVFSAHRDGILTGSWGLACLWSLCGPGSGLPGIRWSR